MPVQVFDVQGMTAYVRSMCDRGGPQISEYEELAQWFRAVQVARKTSVLCDEGLNSLRLAFGPAMGMGTMQGRSMLQQHGYTGDFEIIDETYRHVVSDDSALKRWDEYYHAQGAPRAVRNRKAYFKALVREVLMEHKGAPVEVLDIASGPCRDVAEFLDEFPDAPVRFTCVDLDADAIAYAQRTCARWLDRITFIRCNALRFRMEGRYDLVWSAGLFDYFDDRVFVHLLSRLVGWAKPGAQVAVGNFVGPNPSVAYQDFAGWVLQYRTVGDLLRLGQFCGADLNAMRVEQEDEGINLFLRISVPKLAA